MECYKRNRKEADAFSDCGWSVLELIEFEKETHNPIIKARIQVLLLKRLSDILPQLGWKYGVSGSTGKNASYVVYIISAKRRTALLALQRISDTLPLSGDKMRMGR